ncbi:MAG: hypothetical protein COB36_12480 [Alphaproteobacteria bacterium]|nr:MAG: hypothetical protein COB36_12480 [Alphaproteobacteria bacterium]
MTNVVILQSNYLPWRGYFDLMREADVFIFYDEVQYTRGDWRNRNKIVAANGERWLSLPIAKSGNFGQSIHDTHISDPRWASKHWDTLRGVYGKSAGFKKWGKLIKTIYDELESETALSVINHSFAKTLASSLGITTDFHCSSEFSGPTGKTERLVSLCQTVGASCYISGPAAKTYLDTDLFADAGIDILWKHYPQYLPYPQLDGNYRASVSIIDTLFQAPDLDMFGAI